MATNREFAEQINRAFQMRDLQFFEDHLADDFRWTALGHKPLIGKKAAIDVVKDMPEDMLEFTVTNMVAEGEYVVVESVGKPYSKDGKTYTPNYCDIYRIVDGKFTELFTYYDTALAKEIMEHEQEAHS